jgi:ATP/maltotriose-dependent transcriptional regulator MalT
MDQFVEAMRAARPGPNLAYAIPAMVIPTWSRVTGSVEHFELAEMAATAVLSSPTATPLTTIFARSGKGLIAVQLGDREAALEQYAALQSIRGILVLTGWCGDHVLGLLAQTMGKLDSAVAHFEEALSFCHQAGYKPEYAWSCYDYANVLLQRGNPGDRIKAMSLLNQSLAISNELGMRPLMERVVSLQEEAQTQSGKAPEYLDGLTQREVEVLRLIALGKSNRQIGDELFISLNTVESHVSNILTKIHASNRTDATRYAIRNGLVA